MLLLLPLPPALFLCIQFQEHSITMALSTGTSTRSLHADDVLNCVPDVAPPLHVATTFRYPSDPNLLVPAADADANAAATTV